MAKSLSDKLFLATIGTVLIIKIVDTVGSLRRLSAG
jgi:hypothetical protein